MLSFLDQELGHQFLASLRTGRITGIGGVTTSGHDQSWIYGEGRVPFELQKSEKFIPAPCLIQLTQQKSGGFPKLPFKSPTRAHSPLM